ncbi:MAG: divalent-cation tolerance protein CutA [Candidatus Micrarchaeota archaeon]|nr:divalent-cation tolerance protein CutA [Candidatus Micrarchaeota archaeon]
MRGWIFVYVTYPTKNSAEKDARRLLQKRLAACANIFGPTVSIYRWKGKIVKQKEYIMILKTSLSGYGKIKRAIEKMHPYDTPCIAKLSVQFNKKFMVWLKNELA